MSGKKKILVIDDSSTHILLCQTIFDEEHYEVASAESGKEGLKVIPKVEPDLILLDIMMPEMDGYAVLKELKGKEETKNIPVIMVSAKIQSSDIKKAKELGAINFVKKPIGANRLVEMVNNIMH